MMYINEVSIKTGGGHKQMKKSEVALEEFPVQPLFEHFCDCGAVNGDARPLEPFRVGNRRSVRMREIPEGWMVNNIFQTRGRGHTCHSKYRNVSPPWLALSTHSRVRTLQGRKFRPQSKTWTGPTTARVKGRFHERQLGPTRYFG
jgi:hypothetical protein